MKNERAVYLYNKYFKSELSAEEQLEWDALGLDFDNDQIFQELVDGFWESKKEDVPGMNEVHVSSVEAYILAQPQPVLTEDKPFVKKLWPRIAIASAIALIVIGAYFFRSTFTETDSNNTGLAADIAPGKNGATLTLANGQKIFIDDALAGNIANQSGVKISKTKEGRIIYEVTDQGTDKIEYNTLTTTRGEQTQVRLPDGSLVFLNAVSSLRYPTSFAKSAKRSVGLTGEGYFEISKNKTQPFVVNAAGQQVEVLGTHFNINAYSDEKAVKTTLLEGSVLVAPVSTDGLGADNAKGKILKPGQQSSLTKQGIQVANVNLDEVMAWQKGYFRFYDEDITLIMREISRWYNIEVEYSGVLPRIGFNARIDKNSTIIEVLGKLEKTGDIHFKIEGRKVIVSK
ncbi:FecR family protein [Pedobacter nutrimenti]|uniref:FecR family protein n=1 Tax=Pedobacter nutrimenti TaxID=1241337 RepID=UPI00292F8502|nr:FecR domain-containing protein [Pedobacter nutrimenti]